MGGYQQVHIMSRVISVSGGWNKLSDTLHNTKTCTSPSLLLDDNFPLGLYVVPNPFYSRQPLRGPKMVQENFSSQKSLRRVHPRSESPPPGPRTFSARRQQRRPGTPLRSSSADDIIPLRSDISAIPSSSRRSRLNAMHRQQSRRSKQSLMGSASHHSLSSASSHHPPPNHIRQYPNGIWHYTLLSASFLFRATSVLGAFMFCIQYAIIASGMNVEMKALLHTDWNVLGSPVDEAQQELRQASVVNMASTRRAVRRTVLNVTLPDWVICADGRNVSSCHECAATSQDPAIQGAGGCVMDGYCQWCPYGAIWDTTTAKSHVKPRTGKDDRSVTVYDDEGRITKVLDAHIPLGEQCVSSRQTCRPMSASAHRIIQQDTQLMAKPFFAEMLQKATPHIVPKQCSSRGFQYCPYGALHSYHEAVLKSNNTDSSGIIRRPPQCIPRRLHCQPPDDLLVQPTDLLYKQRYGSAVVIPSHKLIFVPIPKVACTIWYKLLRRMTGLEDWQSDLGPLPQNPDVNGLTYLADYSRAQATDMWTSLEWTKAIMVRDPRERLLSAYLDKVKHSLSRALVHGICCPDTNSCAEDRNMTLSQFVNLLVERECWNTGDHWSLQCERMERKYWPHVTTVLHLDRAATDVQRLLKQVGAWKEFGAFGWGIDGKASIFSPNVTTRHETNAAALMGHYYNSQGLIKQVESLFAKDYTHKRLGFGVTPMADSPKETAEHQKNAPRTKAGTKKKKT